MVRSSLVETGQRTGCVPLLASTATRSPLGWMFVARRSRDVCTRTPASVLASGGISSLDDLRAIAGLDGVEGVIVGKALCVGAFTLPEALNAAA